MEYAVISLLNGTAYGLSSAVCNQRLGYINLFEGGLQGGTVNE